MSRSLFKSPLKNILTVAVGLLLIGGLVSIATAATPHPAFKVDVTGKGAPIILIPGLASSGEVWDGTVARYCGDHQCHVLTLAGFAGVPAIETPLIATAEQQLSEYIATNKIERPLVIGHSLGGFLALKLAADHPEQVSRLIIVDSLPAMAAAQMPSMTGDQMKQMAAGIRTRILSQDAAAYKASQQQTLRTMITKQEDIDRALGWGQRSDRGTVASAMAEMMGDDMRQEINRIKAPTLVLGSWIAYKDFGSKSQFEQTYKSQYQQLAGVKVELSDSARHFIMVDDPAWMYDRIDSFLK